MCFWTLSWCVFWFLPSIWPWLAFWDQKITCSLQEQRAYSASDAPGRGMLRSVRFSWLMDLIWDSWAWYVYTLTSSMERERERERERRRDREQQQNLKWLMICFAYVCLNSQCRPLIYTIPFVSNITVSHVFLSPCSLILCWCTLGQNATTCEPEMVFVMGHVQPRSCQWTKANPPIGYS